MKRYRGARSPLSEFLLCPARTVLSMTVFGRSVPIGGLKTPVASSDATCPRRQPSKESPWSGDCSQRWQPQQSPHRWGDMHDPGPQGPVGPLDIMGACGRDGPAQQIRHEARLYPARHHRPGCAHPRCGQAGRPGSRAAGSLPTERLGASRVQPETLWQMTGGGFAPPPFSGPMLTDQPAP